MRMACGPLASRLLSGASAAGISRVSDITGFDVIGIPVWQAIRPEARSLAASQGKGATAAAAIVSAIMESLELMAAERVKPARSHCLTPEERAEWRRHLPEKLSLAGPVPLVPAVDLFSNRPGHVPHRLVSMDFTAGPDRFHVISTGLGAGLSMATARRKAMLEVIERSAVALFDSLSPRERRRRAFDPAAIADRRCRWALARIARAGCSAEIFSVGAEHGVPVFSVFLLDGNGPARLLPAAGSGAHPDAATALFAALAEAAQARAMLLSGARDDLEADDFHHVDERGLWTAIHYHYDEKPCSAPRSIPAEGLDENLLRGLEHAGARMAMFADLGEALPGIFVGKLIAPGVADSDRAPGPGIPAWPARAA